ncbi:MAG: hypothetical protein KA963_01120 [Candidatus Cloacimonas sp.]|nr:hypothetical protein [Candidatus Cloacimonas sp.]
MKFYKIGICLCLLLIFTASTAYAVMAVPSTGTKKLDLTKYHNVGNIWLRVSNYGFFGSGDDIVPQYPSLEYPGGSGVDYLYQGALWFGAKKQRRDKFNNRLYWLVYPPSEINDTIITANDPRWNSNNVAVMDTLVSVGFDGDWDIYEFLPAYNPLLVSNLEQTDNYAIYNNQDGISYATTRRQKRGVDDDGDGKIDEDGAGFTFPFRISSELPTQFSEDFGGQFLADVPPGAFTILDDPINAEIWFPLGFMDLSYRSIYSNYAFSAPYDDDTDGRIDEDGAPVSEQDYISFYYDYCPFGTDYGQDGRDYGTSSGSSKHYPLNIRVRQMSYQWSYEYIKNLVYVEFDITNMNPLDSLYDCAMGIYMDCDVGPQTWGADKASDDKSGYVKGTGYEFAYTYDADYDNGLTPGIVGARVCTPDPEQLQFHCWYWKVGEGPYDGDPLKIPKPNETSNEKYWLLTGRNPKPSSSIYTPLRPEQEAVTEWEQPTPNDTRFLFSFYGAQPGTPEYNEVDANGNYYKRWNLAPYKTMKIVVAVFPGDNKEDLKGTASRAKEIYGEAQNLITVTLPDTFPHYSPYVPPDIPGLYAELVDNGNRLDVYWDNRSEFSYDTKTASTSIIGWQNPESAFLISGLDSDPTPYIANNWADIPEEFRPDMSLPSDKIWNMNALINPYTASRLRRDFQGYTLWGRSGSGNQEDWEMIHRWDKVETAQDHSDYTINNSFPTYFINFGGYLGIDTDLPNKNEWDVDVSEYHKFYRYDDNYKLAPNGDDFYGWPIYEPNPVINGTPLNDITDWQTIQDYANSITGPDAATTKFLRASIFKHSAIPDSVFSALYEPKLIPLEGFAIPASATGEEHIVPDTLTLSKLRKERLARRYYYSNIMYPRKGIEYYVALTAFDRGIPSKKLDSLESGRDADSNMKVFFPGTLAKDNMDHIMVIPNPYIGRSSFDGRRENDEKGDKSRRLWFINLPKRCTIRIYTLAGDLVQTLEHDGAQENDIITISKAATTGIAADGMHSWDLLTKNRQITAPGVYLFSVENKADGKNKVGKFVIIK